jgi:hypothetical protein
VVLEEFLHFYRSVIYDIDDAQFERGLADFKRAVTTCWFLPRPHPLPPPKSNSAPGGSQAHGLRFSFDVPDHIKVKETEMQGEIPGPGDAV